MKRIRLLAGLLTCLVPALATCGSEPRSALADGSSVDRSAWLGSAETWGLIGIPIGGGPVGYLRALNFEAPTWAPPDLGTLTRVWRGHDAIWVQFEGGGLGRYDYVTGHLLSFEGAPTATRALAAGEERVLVVATGQGELRLVGVGADDGWRHALGGDLLRLEDAGDGRVLALVRSESGVVLRLLHPGERQPLAERAVGDLLDLTVTPWAQRLYYLPAESPEPVLRALSLPDLADADSFVLSRPGYALAATPSGHRLYVAGGRGLHVLDRLGGRTLREVELPETVSALRFGENGAVLLARVANADAAVVVQVGVDAILGTVTTTWGEYLPAALPGGRLATIDGDSLVLYSVRGLLEIARYGAEQGRVWIPVEWQPPRPRPELARAERRTGERRARAPDSEADGATDVEAPPGHYAVVSAARERGGVENLVKWLENVGYPARVDEHSDAMGALWFRAMVGPYPTRPAAEAASRALNARYGYKPWILRVESQDEPREDVRADTLAGPGAVGDSAEAAERAVEGAVDGGSGRDAEGDAGEG